MITKEEATRRFLEQTGMSREKMDRAGITLEPCLCGLSVCNRWIAVGAWINGDGTYPVQVRA